MSWPLVALGDVCSINPRLPKNIDEEQEVTFLGMASVSENGYLLNQEKRILKETKKGFTYFEKDDILVAKITPCFENGKAVFLDQLESEIGFGSTEFHVLRPDSQLDGKYLFYIIWNPYFRFVAEKNMTGSAGQKRVPTDFFKNFKIPLPPLEEQKRIAAILDKADAIRQKRQQAIELADEFLRSVFLDMFGDPVTNPKGWETKALSDVFQLSSGNGLTSKQMNSEGIFKVYGGNGITGHHDEYMFEEPKLTIGRVGVYCGCIHITEPKSWITDNALYVKKYLSEVNVHYLAQLLKMSNLNQYAGVAAQPLISGGRIYPLEIIFPPIELQNNFEVVKNSIKSLFANVSLSTDGMNVLFDSLSQKAFSGQL